MPYKAIQKIGNKLYTGREIETSRYYTERQGNEVVKFRLDIAAGFDMKFGQDHNQAAHFAITCNIFRIAKNGRRVPEGGGAAHDLIAKRARKLARFTRWHLATFDGLPMHYISNACYWAEYALGVSKWGLDVNKDTIGIFWEHVVRLDSDSDILAILRDRYMVADRPYESESVKALIRDDIRRAVTDWCVGRLAALIAEFQKDMIAGGYLVEVPVDPDLDNPIWLPESATLDERAPLELTQIEGFIQDSRLTMTAALIGRQTDARNWTHDAWNCEIVRCDESGAAVGTMVIKFHMGIGLEGTAPTLDDVLENYASTARSVISAADISDFANEFGYDAEDEETINLWESCVEETNKLRDLLGSALFDELIALEV